MKLNALSVLLASATVALGYEGYVTSSGNAISKDGTCGGKAEKTCLNSRMYLALGCTKWHH